MCRRVARVIHHPEGGKTIIYENGSRMQVLPEMQIVGDPHRGEGAPRPSEDPAALRGTRRPEEEFAAPRATHPLERGTEREHPRDRTGARESDEEEERGRERAPSTRSNPAGRPPHPGHPRHRPLPDGPLPQRDQRAVHALARDYVGRVRQRIGGRRTLRTEEVFTLMELTDAEGRNRRLVFAQRTPGVHAEENAYRQLRPHLEGGRYRGGRLRILINQEPCAPGQRQDGRTSCEVHIRRTSRIHGLFTETYVPARRSQTGGVNSARTAFSHWLANAEPNSPPPPFWRLDTTTWDDRPTVPRTPPRGDGDDGSGRGRRQSGTVASGGESADGSDAQARPRRLRLHEVDPAISRPEPRRQPPIMFRPVAPDPSPIRRMGVSMVSNVMAELATGVIHSVLDHWLLEAPVLPNMPAATHIQRIQRDTNANLSDVDGFDLREILERQLPITARELARLRGLHPLWQDFRRYRERLDRRLAPGTEEINALSSREDREIAFGDLVAYFHDETIALRVARDDIRTVLYEHRQFLQERVRAGQRAYDALLPALGYWAGHGVVSPEVAERALHAAYLYRATFQNLLNALEGLDRDLSTAITRNAELIRSFHAGVQAGFLVPSSLATGSSRP